MAASLWAFGEFVATYAGVEAGTALFTLTAGAVAVGTAYGLSRVVNGNQNKGPNSAQGSQGGRIQIPPATNNKIPIVYGNAFVNGIITDARLKSLGGENNDTMYYCIVLSETCNNASAAYTVDDIYWNDLRLVFDATNKQKAIEGRKNVDNPDGVTEDFVDTNFVVDGKSFVEVRVYAGSSAAADQIFPTTGAVPAWEMWGDNDGSWTSDYKMQGLVFAIIKLTYGGEKGFTGLANMTFKLDNNINNPADVWYDYMTSKRYGAGIETSAIDTTPTTSAFAKWQAYYDDEITYTPIGGGSTTQKRYTINSIIDTSQQVKANIDSILQNGGAWMSYNVATGLWQPIPKRAATSGELDAALQFSDDNIISGITMGSTRLEDLYNKFEVEFYNKYNKDQKAYARLNLPAALRNANEPDNQLRMNLDLVNNSVQAELIGQLELRQSRDDIVIDFDSTFYGIQAQAGDVISVYNELYGWCAPTFPDGKYFRVMRVKEIESDDGNLTASIQAVEYNPDAYTVEPITEFTTIANIGIGNLVSSVGLPSPDNPTITNVRANDSVPNFTFNVAIPTTGGPFDEIEIYYTEGWDPNSVTGWIDNNSTPGTYSGVAGNIMTVTSVTYNSINPGDYFDLGGVTVVSQLTQTAISTKTFSSGGAPGAFTFTLNNVTGVVIGQKPGLNSPAVGIPADAMVVAISGNTVTLDKAFTVQASGNYNFTTAGGTGTYTVNIPTATTGTDDLFDQPVDSDFIFLKKITPPGNASNFETGGTLSAIITELPANSQLYRRYFLKARLGVKKNFGAFTNNVPVDLDGNSVNWQPNPIGELNTSVPSVITLHNREPGTYSAPGAPLILRHLADGTITNGFGTTMTYEVQTPGSGTVVGAYHDVVMTDSTTGLEDFQWGIGLMKNGVPPSGSGGGAPVERQFIIDGNGDVQITGTLTLNYEEDAASSIIYGKTNAADSSLTWNGVSWDFANNFGLVLNNTTTPKGVQGIIAANDYWFVGGYDPSGTGSNNGAMVIASGNNGNEPIYVRQYGGGGNPSTGIPGANTITNELTLLDASGNTTLPGTLKLEGSTSGSITLSAGATPTATTYTLPSADGTNGYVLSTNGSGTLSWIARGDVVGPSSATDNAVARFNLTTGKLIQNSGVTIDDNNNIDLGIGSITQGSSTNTASFSGSNAAGNTTIDTFAAATYRSGKYAITFTKGTDYQILELDVIHNGTTSYINTYSDMKTASNLVTLATSISSGNVLISGTVVGGGTLTWRVYRVLFNV